MEKFLNSCCSVLGISSQHRDKIATYIQQGCTPVQASLPLGVARKLDVYLGPRAPGTPGSSFQTLAPALSSPRQKQKQLLNILYSSTAPGGKDNQPFPSIPRPMPPPAMEPVTVPKGSLWSLSALAMPLWPVKPLVTVEPLLLPRQESSRLAEKRKLPELGAVDVAAIINDSVEDGMVAVLQAELSAAEQHVASLRAKLARVQPDQV